MPWWHTADDNEVLSVFDLLWYFNHTEVYCIFLTQKRHQHIKTESLQGSLTKRKENSKAVQECKQHRDPTFFESLQGSLEKDILQKHTGTLNMSHPQWNGKNAFIHVTKKYFLVILYRVGPGEEVYTGVTIIIFLHLHYFLLSICEGVDFVRKILQCL